MIELREIGCSGLSWRRMLVRVLLTPLPLKKRLIQMLAMAPPQLKGRFAMRIAGNLLVLSGLPRDHLVRARIPAAPGFIVDLPVWAGPHQLFADGMAIDHESTSVEACRALAPHCDSVFDVGAHLGGFVWHLVGGIPEHIRYVSVEPSNQLAQLLLRNLAANGLEERVEVVHAAIGAVAGDATFYFNQDEPAMSTTVASFGTAYRRCEERTRVVPLSDLLIANSSKCALVKIDVEGAERVAMSGLVAEIARVRAVIFEILEPEVASGFVGEVALRFGMRAFHIEERVLRGVAPWDPRSEHRNWLFVRAHDAAALAALSSAGFTFA